VKTFRYRLYPSGTQRRLLESTVETCRRLYNDCLAERKEAWEAEKRNVRKVEQLRRVKVVKAATSDGETIGHPKWYRREQARLRVLQGRVARRKKGGANRGKAVRAVARHALHIANRRKDFLGKLAHSLVERYDLIALEDLRIPNMVKNRHLAKSIMDSGWGYFRTHLAHKAAEAGRVVVLVDPAYTSQTCSACDNRFPKHIGLSIRHVSCSCGLSLDRDINAARNILRAGRARREPTSASAGVSREAAPL